MFFVHSLHILVLLLFWVYRHPLYHAAEVSSPAPSPSSRLMKSKSALLTKYMEDELIRGKSVTLKQDPLPKTIYDIEENLTVMLMGAHKMPGVDTPQPKKGTNPKFKSYDYLIKPVPEELKKKEATRILHAEKADEEPTVGKMVMADLCKYQVILSFVLV